MRKLAIVFIAVLYGLFSVAASAKTIEVKSENFVLIGDLSEKNGRKLVLELEQYREAVMQLLGATNVQPEVIPVRIYTAKGSSNLEKMTGMVGIGGVYSSTFQGPVFILDSSGGFSRGNHARATALHEYTHHLMAAYTDKFYPRWYNEGIANYFSTFEVRKDGTLEVGRPYQPYGYALSQSKWMPMKTVVGSIRSYPFTRSKKKGLDWGSYYYAQSWLAVHYLQSNKEETEKLIAYLDLLNSEDRPAKPFEAAFGYTPEAFEVKLKEYYRRNKYPYRKITLKKRLSAIDIKVRSLDKGEAEFHKAEAMRFFSGSRVKTAQVRAQYDKAAKKLGETAHILAARADLASWDSDYPKAMNFANKALSLAPKDGAVNGIAGVVLVNKYEYDEKSDPADLENARKYLKKALLANGDDINSHYYYARSFSMTGDRANGQAVASARTALDYYRAINFVDSNLNLVGLLLNADKKSGLMPIVEKAIVWGNSPGARSQARRMRKHLRN